MTQSRNPEFKLFRSKRGVLLYGPPGTGKTTIGRALAHRLRGKFFLIDGTFIAGTQNFYNRISQVFEAAKDNAPSVIFIDDADAIFEDGEEQALYRYLLTMLDGLESESAGRVCGIDDVLLRLRDGNTMVSRAHFGPISHGPVEISIDVPPVRWVRERGTLHIPDVRAQNEIPLLDPGPLRTFLIVPLRQQEEVIGALAARRMEVRPFTAAQIKLLETFADQAVIAIENVRLFQELEARTRELARSVGELKALGEVGQAVSRGAGARSAEADKEGQVVIAAFGLGGVKADDVRQHDADCHAMRHAEVRRERIGQCVGRAEHRVFDRHAGETGAELHPAAGVDILRLIEHAVIVSRQQAPGFAAECGRG